MLPPVPVMVDNEQYAEIIHPYGLVNVLQRKIKNR